MADKPARFRDLSKVNKQIEAAFHAAGLLTWADLVIADPADLVALAGEVRTTTSEQVAAWQSKAAELIANGGGDGLGGDEVAVPVEEDAERRHAFVITVVTDDEALVLRSSIRNARTGVAGDWRGWSVDRIARFIEAEAGVGSPTVPWRTEQLPSSAGSFVAQLFGRPVGGSIEMPLAALRGELEPGRDLALDFGNVRIPAGAHHLRVSLDAQIVGG
jgi:hypothetical protein